MRSEQDAHMPEELPILGGRSAVLRRASHLAGAGRLSLLAGLFVSLALTACGGGGGSGDPAGGPVAGTPDACSVVAQQGWLAGYMDEWYFWTQRSPRPVAAGFTTVDGYFAALLYTGADGAFPADRWSRVESSASFDRFFGDGATLGYGVAVAGIELAGDATKPLRVRYVEPGSPAAAAGVARGDEVLGLNGRSAASLITANDFSALTAAQLGQTLNLQLRRAGVERTLSLSAAVYSLTPVQGVVVTTTAGGRRLGVLQVKDMIAQSLAPLDAAFAQFRSAAVQDLVLDLRYNGGGLVSTGATLASYIAGAPAAGQPYARLLYNERRAASNNQTFPFTVPAQALGLPRVYVLTGPRTCSASEQLIGGLRGAGVEVITVGATTCGKPVGFLPVAQCGRTYSAVNFESVNARGEGRYFDGFTPTCSVAEDFAAPQGSVDDPLQAMAESLADGAACPRPPVGVARPQSARAATLGVETGERQGMIPR